MAYSLGEAVGYIKLNIKEFLDNSDKVKKQTEEINNTADSMGTIFDKAAKLAAAAFAAVSVAAGKAIKDVISAGSSFEAAMSKVAATMGMSAEDVNKNVSDFRALSEAAKEAGATTMFSATQSAEALNYLALAGKSAEESIAMLPDILNVAAAGGMDLARASDMVTDAMSALGLATEDTQYFTSQLARTAQKSNTSVEQLGDAILQIGGTAKILKGGVTELDTALGILANNGIKAGEGGTGLRQVLNNLTAPTQKAQKLMDELGFSMYDTAGEIKPLNQAFRELDEIIGGLSDQRQQEVLSTLFDARHLKSARALLSNYGETWDNLYEQIENANGAAGRMAETMQNNLQGALTTAKSALEAVQVTAYEALKESLTNAVKSATEPLKKLNDKLKEPEMQKALKTIADSITDLLVKFTEFTANTAIPKLIEWGGKLETIGDNLKAVLSGLAVALPLVAAGLVACNVSVQASVAAFIAQKAAVIAANAALLANPYTLAAAALGGLTAAIVGLTKEQERMLQDIQNGHDEFRELAEAARENAEAFENTQNSMEEMRNEYVSQVSQIKDIVSELGNLANKEDKTNEEKDREIALTKQLLELYPDSIDYIRNGQVTAYDKLSESVDNYIRKLMLQKEIESRQEAIGQYYDEYKKAQENMEGLQEKVDEAQKQFDKWNDYYDKATGSVRKLTDEEINLLKAETNGKVYGQNTAKKYIQQKRDMAVSDLTYAQEALITNQKTEKEAKEHYDTMIDELKDYQDDYYKEQAHMGELKDKGVYANQQQAYIEEQKKTAEKTTQSMIEIQNKKWEDGQYALEKLERDWQLRNIKTEKEYMEKKKEILAGIKDPTNDKWIKEWNKVLKWEESENDKRTKELERQQKENERIQKENTRNQEEEIKKQIKNLERRVKTEKDYTEEMMYNDMETIRNGLKEETEIWDYVNDKIVDGRARMQETIDKQNEKAANKSFSTWQKQYNDFASEAEKAYRKIESSTQKFEDNIKGSVKLYETETKKVWNRQKQTFEQKETFTINSKQIKNQIKETKKYLENLEKIKKAGAGEGLINQILGMDSETAKKYAEELAKKGQGEIKKISDGFDEIDKMTKEATEEYYSDQLTEFQTKYADKAKKIIENIPSDIKLVGEDTISGFIQGIEEKSESADGKLKEVFDDFTKGVKEKLGIHSPSTVFAEIGENILEGTVVGAENKKEDLINKFAEIGTTAGNKFSDGFKTIWDKMVETIKNSTQNLVDVFNLSEQITAAASIPNLAYSAANNSGNGYSNLVNNNYNYGGGITKNDIVSAIKQAVPDGDINLQINGRQFALIARSELNNLSADSGNLALKV